MLIGTWGLLLYVSTEPVNVITCFYTNFRCSHVRAFVLPGPRASYCCKFLRCLSYTYFCVALSSWPSVSSVCLMDFDCKWWWNEGLFLYIRSCRLRAFALPGLRANAAESFLGCLRAAAKKYWTAVFLYACKITIQNFPTVSSAPPVYCLCEAKGASNSSWSWVCSL